MPASDTPLHPNGLARPAAPPSGSGVCLSALAAADLQDDMMVAGNDLDRLQRLLDHASQTLMGHFTQATSHIDNCALAAARRSVGHAITALQFQDMASQLIGHTKRRLRGCADRIARDALGVVGDGMAVADATPLRPNPVTQDEMAAGSVELF